MVIPIVLNFYYDADYYKDSSSLNTISSLDQEWHIFSVSRCTDGVVLIADTKITVDGGARYEYEDKLTGEIRGVITGFSGDKEPFTEFRMRLRAHRTERESKFAKKSKVA